MLNEIDSIEEKYPQQVYLESIKRGLYDCEPLKQKETWLFTSPMGYGQKDRVRTNMLQAGNIPMPESMTMTHRPRVTLFVESGLVDLNRKIWRETLFSFFKNSMIYFQGPLWMFASPVAVLHGSQGLPESDRKQLVDEICAPLGEAKVVIDPGDPFQVTIETELFDSRYSAVVELPGDYSRAL